MVGLVVVDGVLKLVIFAESCEAVGGYELDVSGVSGGLLGIVLGMGSVSDCDENYRVVGSCFQDLFAEVERG